MTARFAVLALALLGTAASAAEQSLLEAAEAGDRTAALAALKAGDDVDARAADGTTALIWAAYNGDAELAERLIAAGADLDVKNEFGASALSEAAIGGYSAVIARVARARGRAQPGESRGRDAVDGRRADGQCRSGQVAARCRCRCQRHRAFGPAIRADVGRRAGATRDDEAADCTRRSSQRAWRRSQLGAQGHQGAAPEGHEPGRFTPLLYAAREGCIECAKELVAGGADLDCRTRIASRRSTWRC